VRKWIPVIIVLAAVAASIFVYPQLPERVPTHWSTSGEVDGWSSRFWGAWLMPLVLAGTWLLMRAIPHIDPRRENYAKFMNVYEIMVIAVMLLLLGAHLLILAMATGHNVSLTRVMPAGIGGLFIVMGVLLPRVQPNWFVGIRTPWTLSSDLAWERTHRTGGYLFIAAGVLIVLTALLAPALTFKVLLGTALTLVVFLFVYSYIVWKQDPARSAT
jgi:uncharacterized membrane protein